MTYKKLKLELDVAYGDIWRVLYFIGEAKGMNLWSGHFPIEVMSVVFYLYILQDLRIPKSQEDPEIRRELQQIVDKYNLILETTKGTQQRIDAEKEFENVCKKLHLKYAHLCEELKEKEEKEKRDKHK